MQTSDTKTNTGAMQEAVAAGRKVHAWQKLQSSTSQTKQMEGPRKPCRDARRRQPTPTRPHQSPDMDSHERTSAGGKHGDDPTNATNSEPPTPHTTTKPTPPKRPMSQGGDTMTYVHGVLTNRTTGGPAATIAPARHPTSTPAHTNTASHVFYTRDPLRSDMTKEPKGVQEETMAPAAAKWKTLPGNSTRR